MGMIEQEAIKKLSIMSWTNGSGQCTQLEHEEAKEVAFKALEKQIPKKPYIWGDGYYDGQLVYDMYNCPNCNKSYEMEYDEYDYCPNCGQHLNWGRNEDAE